MKRLRFRDFREEKVGEEIGESGTVLSLTLFLHHRRRDHQLWIRMKKEKEEKEEGNYIPFVRLESRIAKR